MAVAFRIPKAVDPKRFSRAFQTLVDHTDVLRCCIEVVDDEPRQRFLPTAVAQLEQLDFSQSPVPDQHYQHWLAERCRRILPLDRPAYDCVLVKLGENEWAWYFNQHHLFVDAWSLSVLFQRLNRFYQVDASITDSSPQFRQTLTAPITDAANDRLERAKAHWDRQRITTTPTRFYRTRPPQLSGQTETEFVMALADLVPSVSGISHSNPRFEVSPKISRIFRSF